MTQASGAPGAPRVAQPLRRTRARTPSLLTSPPAFQQRKPVVPARPRARAEESWGSVSWWEPPLAHSPSPARASRTPSHGPQDRDGPGRPPAHARPPLPRTLLTQPARIFSALEGLRGQSAVLPAGARGNNPRRVSPPCRLSASGFWERQAADPVRLEPWSQVLPHPRAQLRVPAGHRREGGPQSVGGVWGQRSGAQDQGGWRPREGQPRVAGVLLGSGGPKGNTPGAPSERGQVSSVRLWRPWPDRGARVEAVAYLGAGRTGHAAP